MKSDAVKAIEKTLNSGLVYKVIIEEYYDGKILKQNKSIYFYPGDTVTINANGFDVELQENK